MRTPICLAQVLILAVGLTSAAKAQTTIAVGPKAGINFANVSGDDAEGTDARIGFAFGGVAEFRISEMWSIQPEAYYSSQGTKENDEFVVIDQPGTTNDLIGEADVNSSLDYIRIPVFLKLTIPTNGGIRPYLFAGPEFALKMRCKSKVEGKTLDLEGRSESVDCDEVQPGTVESLDYGLGFGGGIGVPVGSGTLAVDARYGLGLADILDVSAAEVDIKNSNIQIAVTYLFTLGP